MCYFFGLFGGEVVVFFWYDPEDRFGDCVRDVLVVLHRDQSIAIVGDHHCRRGDVVQVRARVVHCGRQQLAE